MTPAQAAFLGALVLVLGGVGVVGIVVARRMRAAVDGVSPSLLERLGRPSTARLEVHRWAFLAHRIGGLAILGFLALHLVDVGLVAVSPALYDEVHSLYGTPLLRVFEVGLLAAILFHAANGLRLVVIDLVDIDSRAAERLLWVAIVVSVGLTVPAAAVILGPVFG